MEEAPRLVNKLEYEEQNVRPNSELTIENMQPEWTTRRTIM